MWLIFHFFVRLHLNYLPSSSGHAVWLLLTKECASFLWVPLPRILDPRWRGIPTDASWRQATRPFWLHRSLTKAGIAVRGGVKRKCLDPGGLGCIMGRGHLEPETDTWDCTRPTSADVQVDRWRRRRLLSSYTNMCAPLYWTAFFRWRGMHRKSIACFLQSEESGELL